MTAIVHGEGVGTVRDYQNRRMLAGVLCVTCTLVLVPAIASAALEANAANEGEVDAVLEPTINDGLFEASRMLEDAGVLGANSELAGLVADSKITEDGALELIYFSDHERASEFVQRVEKVDGVAEMVIRAVPTESDPDKLNALAERVSLGGKEDLDLLGVTEISGVRADTERGVLIVSLPEGVSHDPGATTVLDRVPVEFDSNSMVQLHSRDADAAP